MRLAVLGLMTFGLATSAGAVSAEYGGYEASAGGGEGDYVMEEIPMYDENYPRVDEDWGGDEDPYSLPPPWNPLPVPYEIFIVQKVNTLPWGAGSLVCTLYNNRAVITRSFGFDHTITESRELDLDGNFWALVEQAQKERPRKEQNYLCDGATTHVTTTSGTVLYSTGACGNPKIYRTGPATARLRDMIDHFCPKTY